MDSPLASDYFLLNDLAGCLHLLDHQQPSFPLAHPSEQASSKDRTWLAALPFLCFDSASCFNLEIDWYSALQY